MSVDDLDECACGHIRDEHDDQQACTVEVDGEPCDCFYFELSGGQL